MLLIIRPRSAVWSARVWLIQEYLEHVSDERNEIKNRHSATATFKAALLTSCGHTH
jgi:hypothetical protein